MQYDIQRKDALLEELQAVRCEIDRHQKALVNLSGSPADTRRLGQLKERRGILLDLLNR